MLPAQYNNSKISNPQILNTLFYAIARVEKWHILLECFGRVLHAIGR